MDTQLHLTATVEQPPMLTRAAFLKFMCGAGLGGTGLLFPAPSLAAADDDVVVVYPTGVFPRDIDEVSAAVNGGVGPSGISYVGGSTVLLKATNMSGVPTVFNFGDGAWPETRGTVVIEKDTVILGEKCKAAPQMLPADSFRDTAYTPDRTIVYGGKRPFACPAANTTPTRLTIRGVYFAYPSLAAVQVAKSAGLVVTDCVIYDVKSDVTDAPALIPSAALGIEATGLTQASPNLTGEFRIEDNRIWRRPPTSGFYAVDMGIALQLASMSAAIRRNDVVGFAYGGIGIDRNTLSGSISDNRVVRCGYGPLAVSAGIGARSTTLPIAISRNEIECGEHGPSQWSRSGISLVGSAGAMLASNAVSGSVAFVGIGLSNAASSCALYGNRLKNLRAGTAQVQLAEGCQENTLVSNEYGGLDTAGVAGALIRGAKNQLVNERFWGAYLGHPQPCVWFTTTSSGNAISHLKHGHPANWAVCTQVRDEGMGNLIAGLERCSRK